MYGNWRMRRISARTRRAGSIQNVQPVSKTKSRMEGLVIEAKRRMRIKLGNDAKNSINFNTNKSTGTGALEQSSGKKRSHTFKKGRKNSRKKPATPKLRSRESSPCPALWEKESCRLSART